MNRAPNVVHASPVCGTRSAGRAKEAHVATKTSRAHIPNGKISEAFLDFASPLIEAAGPEAGRPEIEPILKIAFAVWNAVVIETVRGDSRFVDEIRQAMAAAPGASALVESLLSRKRLAFANDDRLIGNYELLRENGEWILRAEARDPRGGSS